LPDLAKTRQSPQAVDPKRAKRKRASEPALFHVNFLLPVGLADLMGRRYGGLNGASTGILQQLPCDKDEKKPRLFKGAASLTGRKSLPGGQKRARQEQTGTEGLKMYFDCKPPVGASVNSG
jgi:hypothetical protein